MKSAAEAKSPRLSQRRASVLNQSSTGLSHEPCWGVKGKTWSCFGSFRKARRSTPVRRLRGGNFKGSTRSRRPSVRPRPQPRSCASLAGRCDVLTRRPCRQKRRLAAGNALGAQSYGLDTRCLRFARWVACTGRKPRFRLMTRLYRVGLATPRIPSKGFRSVIVTFLPPFPSLLAQCQDIVKRLKGTSEKGRRAQILLRAGADGPMRRSPRRMAARSDWTGRWKWPNLLDTRYADLRRGDAGRATTSTRIRKGRSTRRSPRSRRGRISSGSFSATRPSTAVG